MCVFVAVLVGGTAIPVVIGIGSATVATAGDWAVTLDIMALGLQRRQMFIMTSNVESREMKEAKVY
jgi:hypothetical protein